MSNYIYLVMRMDMSDLSVEPITSYEDIVNAVTAVHNLGELDKEKAYSYYIESVALHRRQVKTNAADSPVRFEGAMDVDEYWRKEQEYQSLQSIRENIPA